MLNKYEVGNRWAAALHTADFAELGQCLAQDVRIQALLPGNSVTATGRDEVVALLRRWLGEPHGFALLATSSGLVGDVLHLSYRARIDGDQPYLLEQQAYCEVGGEGISSLRLVCSGWKPVPAPAAAGT
jgi:hypothetical protein